MTNEEFSRRAQQLERQLLDEGLTHEEIAKIAGGVAMMGVIPT